MNEQIHYNGINYYDKTVLLFFFGLFTFRLYYLQQAPNPGPNMNPTPAPKPKGNIYILTQRCSGDDFTQIFFEDSKLKSKSWDEESY